MRVTAKSKMATSSKNKPAAKLKTQKKAAFQKKTSALSLNALQETLLNTQRMMADTRQQVAYVHAVLEEIAERQALQASWQYTVAKHVFEPAPAVSQSPQRSPQSDGEIATAEITFTAEVRPGETLPHEAVAELTAAAEKALHSIQEKRAETKAKGLLSIKNILKDFKLPDEKSDIKFICIPTNDEIH